MSNHINDWLTHVDNAEDKPYLLSRLFQVNMRLFHANEDYRKVVLACCDHIAKICLAEFEGYKLPHGTSGANAAIPFNIIAIARNRGLKTAYAEVMINPTIEEYRGERVTTESNCGSIRLAAPIAVSRRAEVLISFFNRAGELKSRVFNREEGSFTIQHEVDHNNGVLITSFRRKVK